MSYVKEYLTDNSRKSMIVFVN